MPESTAASAAEVNCEIASMRMQAAVTHEQSPGNRSPRSRNQSSRPWFRAGSVALLMVLGPMYFHASPASAQSTDNANQSWTDTSESHIDGANPTRTVQSHSQSGNRTADSQSIQRLGSDGSFEPYQDIEKETVKVDG